MERACFVFIGMLLKALGTEQLFWTPPTSLELKVYTARVP
jgi:hypothetical protein